MSHTKNVNQPAASGSSVEELAELADGGETDHSSSAPPKEIGGRDGPDPTRYGDWEKSGRCIDF